MKEAVKILLALLAWFLGVVMLLGLMITTKALKFFERLEERFSENESEE